MAFDKDIANIDLPNSARKPPCFALTGEINAIHLREGLPVFLNMSAVLPTYIYCCLRTCGSNVAEPALARKAVSAGKIIRHTA
jgi:hypothetical protein